MSERVCVQDGDPRDLTCRPRADACMEGGFPGTQICDLDEDAQTAECIEDDEVDCTSALDCVGDRICNGRECTEPTACEDDALEPNDTAEDAVDLQQSGYVRQGGVAASICDGDTDVFTYDLSQDGLDRGTFTVRVKMHPRTSVTGSSKSPSTTPRENWSTRVRLTTKANSPWT
ncbi:MAG: hypothetical protein ACOC9W_03780 [Persicimonas sp.]